MIFWNFFCISILKFEVPSEYEFIPMLQDFTPHLHEFIHWWSNSDWDRYSLTAMSSCNLRIFWRNQDHTLWSRLSLEINNKKNIHLLDCDMPCIIWHWRKSQYMKCFAFWASQNSQVFSLFSLSVRCHLFIFFSQKVQKHTKLVKKGENLRILTSSESKKN